MRNSWTGFMAAVFLAFAGVTSQADVIYDNGGPNGYIGVTSSYFATILDDFELQSGASTITDFHWYGAYYDDVPQSDDFTLYIFDENYNLLNTIDGSGATRVGTGDSTTVPFVGGDYDEYYYELFIDPLALTPNTTYYLGIANANDAYWAWEYNAVFSGDATLWFQDSNYFQEAVGEFAYEITGNGEGVVPEPASLTLLGLGLVGVAIRKRRSA